MQLRPIQGLAGVHMAFAWWLLVVLALGSCDSEDIRSLPEAKGLPGVPLLSATASGTTVTLNWPSVQDATGYTLYWSTTPGVTPATGTPIPVVAPPYAHTGLLQGTTYYYVGTATIGGTESPSSNIASAVTIPPTPTGFLATGGSRQMTFTWAPTPGATSYDLYWLPFPGVNPVSGNPINNVLNGHVHGGLFNDTPYFFVLTATNAAGTSVPTPEVLGFTAIPNVAVFMDPAFVGAAGSPGDEGSTILQSVQWWGYPAFPFIGPNAFSFSSALVGMDVLVIPELELGDLSLAMGPDVAVIESFVANGGTLVTASGYTRMADLLNATFGFALVPAGTFDPSFPLSGAQVGTIFQDAPPFIPWNNATDILTNLPPGAIPIYMDFIGPVVSQIPYGAGNIVILGWDWFDAFPLGFQDGGWLPVLQRALRL